MGAASSSPARAALAEEALAVARVAHPRISIDDAFFLSHLRRHLPADADRAIVAGWHVADLYLASASGRGDRVACAELDRAHLSRVPAMLSRLRDAGPIVDDVRQLVAEKLLVPEGDVDPKILGYSGEAPLGAWLRVVVVRAAIGVLRKKSHAPGGERDDEIDGIARAADTELDYVRLRYRAEFDRAFREAFARLDVSATGLTDPHLLDDGRAGRIEETRMNKVLFSALSLALTGFVATAVGCTAVTPGASGDDPGACSALADECGACSGPSEQGAKIACNSLVNTGVAQTCSAALRVGTYRAACHGSSASTGDTTTSGSGGASGGAGAGKTTSSSGSGAAGPDAAAPRIRLR